MINNITTRMNFHTILFSYHIAYKLVTIPIGVCVPIYTKYILPTTIVEQDYEPKRI